MNPNQKTNSIVQKLKVCERFTILDELKQKLTNSLKTEVSTMGYIEPGHGMKGKQHHLESDEDLDCMYGDYLNKRILLWCFAA